jgi:hypothetical protein
LNAKPVDGVPFKHPEGDLVAFFRPVLVAPNSRTFSLFQVAGQIQGHLLPLGISPSDVRFPDHLFVQEQFHPVIPFGLARVIVFDKERNAFVGMRQLNDLDNPSEVFFLRRRIPSK